MNVKATTKFDYRIKFTKPNTKTRVEQVHFDDMISYV